MSKSDATDSNITVSDLEVMSEAENYRNWMYRQIAPFIGQRILEVGAGIGNFTSLLLDREMVLPVDKYLPCVEHLQERLGHHLRVQPRQVDIADPLDQVLKDYRFDTVICMNVLEHIADDLSALSNMRTVLVPGGKLILLVPAFQFLYGTVDRSLEHYRRYTKRELLPKMLRTGFQVEKAFYMNFIGMAGWFVNNRLLKWREESASQIGLFDRFVAPWAERIEKLVPPPIGLSLIAVGRTS
jgi:2-polyprenyl-3-methyl-5-hydroxy-6-metoxy-1,4-benzoquinol methylase